MEDLYSLLIPLAQTRLIVPRACVGEVVGFNAESVRAAREPRWLLGTFNWEGRAIPVISFEGACGLDVPQLEGRLRVVVLRCLGNQLEAGYFGMVTQGFPQLVRVNRAVLQADPTSKWPEDSPVLCQLRMINQRPLIPDVERLERMIVDAAA